MTADPAERAMTAVGLACLGWAAVNALTHLLVPAVAATPWLGTVGFVSGTAASVYRCLRRRDERKASR